MSESLATGASLTPGTFADFKKRLRHDCVGEGVRDHCTSHAIFIVEKKAIIYGLDVDYSDKRVLIDHCNEGEWFSPKEYWDGLDSDERAALNKAMQAWSECQFMKADESDQWYVLGKLDSHSVTGWDERWEYVGAHFTKDAAEAFIKRKKHDYRKGLRVYVDSQYYAWEFEAIKGAILSGKLLLKSETSAQRYMIDWPEEELVKHPAGEVVLVAEHLGVQAELAHMTALRDTWYEQYQELRTEQTGARSQRDALQQRLAVAEQREADLKKLLCDVINEAPTGFAALKVDLANRVNDALKPVVEPDDEIPDFGGGSGNKARRRAEALGLTIDTKA